MAKRKRRTVADQLNELREVAAKKRQRAELVVSRVEFQKDVRRIRKAWKIPVAGFPTPKLTKNPKDRSQFQKWQDDLYERTDKYHDRVAASDGKRVVSLRKQGKLRDAYELQRKLNDEAPARAFEIEIRELAKKNDLPENWDEGIRSYVLLNLGPTPKRGPWIGHKLDEDNFVTNLQIQVFKDTRQKDVDDMWGTVKLLQKDMRGKAPKKLQPLRYIKRDKRIEELSRKGEPDKNIAEVIRKEFGMSPDPDQIRTIRRNYRRRQGTN